MYERYLDKLRVGTELDATANAARRAVSYLHWDEGDADSVLPSLVVELNTWPQITSLIAMPTRIAPGELTALTAEAVDGDGDPLSYAWSASYGEVSLAQTSGNATSMTLDSDTAAGLLPWGGPALLRTRA